MLLLFRSTHDVIKAEKALRQQRIPRRVIPVPRSISSQCGMALEIAPEHAEEAIELLDATLPSSASQEGGGEKRYQIYIPESDP
jgi:hypothetical protein